MMRMDLNCDMGEVPAAISDGTQESLMPSLTSVSVACGAYAGDLETMKATVEQALRWRLAVGAHPGYPDRENFGRAELNLSPETIADFVFEQVHALAEVAACCGGSVTHVKPHGALYNQAATSPVVAQAIADGVAHWSRDVTLVGLAGSVMLDVFCQAGFRVAAEAFADRRYESNGSLRPRRSEDALICDPAEAGQQALHIAARGTVIARDGTEIAANAETICIHGDTPGAPKIAAAVAQTLRQAGVELRPLLP